MTVARGLRGARPAAPGPGYPLNYYPEQYETWVATVQSVAATLNDEGKLRTHEYDSFQRLAGVHALEEAAGS